MRIARTLWEATRPRMFPVWLCSGLVPAVAAWSDGVFDAPTFLLETLLCYALLTLSCWADELGDLEHGVDNEFRVGPVRPLQRGEISRREMAAACVVLAIASVAVGVALLIRSFLVNPGSFAAISALAVLGCGFVALAFAYTMGERPYGYRGLGDLVAFVCFGPVACVGGYWMYAHEVSWSVLLPACAVGLLLAATINLQNVRDMENDAANGKVTLACRLGLPGALRYQYALVVSACLCYLSYFPAVEARGPWLLLLVGFLPLAGHCVRFGRMVTEGEGFARLDDLMWPLTRGMLVACLCFCLAVVACQP